MTTKASLVLQLVLHLPLLWISMPVSPMLVVYNIGKVPCLKAV